MEITAAATPLSYSPQPTQGLVGASARGEQRGAIGPQQLSDEEQKQVQELKQRDREVRAHEAAHMAAGSGLVRGGASYQYQQGPDGKNYAVGGEVSIDSSPVRGDPEATLAKAQKIRAAALAPADPSSQDRAVAAQASQMAAQAQMEIAKQRQEERAGQTDPSSGGSPVARTSGQSADWISRYTRIQGAVSGSPQAGQRPAQVDLFS